MLPSEGEDSHQAKVFLEVKDGRVGEGRFVDVPDHVQPGQSRNTATEDVRFGLTAESR